MNPHCLNNKCAVNPTSTYIFLANALQSRPKKKREKN